MTLGGTLAVEAASSILDWAVERRAGITVSLLADGQWCNLRSHIIRLDAQEGLLQIIYPISVDTMAPPEIAPGEKLGISLRRGHKKCVFVSPVLMRRMDTTGEGDPIDTLIVRAPKEVRELQRRLYQRVTVPDDAFIAVKLWLGGLPSGDETTWPLCAGRVANASVGGLLIDIRADQNPRLGVGDVVGVEITSVQGRPPLLADAQYRHCVMIGPGRIGLGVQFVGLEHNLPGRSTISQIAEFVKSLRMDSVASSRL